MTGIVISYNALHIAHIPVYVNCCQKLAYILYLLTECLSTLRVNRIVPQQVTVLFERGTAPCRVDDDGIAVVIFKYVNIMSGQVSSTFTLSTVDVQGSAAILL